MGTQKRTLGVIARRATQKAIEQINATEVLTFDNRRVTLGDIHQGKARYVVNLEGKNQLRQWEKPKPPKSERPLCGAKCRTGQPCKARVCLRANGTLAARCRMHGGLSTGPKSLRPCPKDTPEKRALILQTIRCADGRLTIKRLCQLAGIAPNTFYLWQTRDTEFKQVADQAWRDRRRRMGIYS